MAIEKTHRVITTNGDEVITHYGHVDVDGDFATDENIFPSYSDEVVPLDGADVFYYVSLYAMILNNQVIQIERINHKIE